MLARILFIILICIGNLALAQNAPEKSLISVTGESEIYVKPDEVSIQMTVEVNDKDLAIAQTKNDEITGKVLKLLKDRLKIDEKFVQTNYINVNPVYQYDNCGTARCQAPTFSHFSTRKGIDVKLKDATLLQKLLQGAIDSGVTNIDNVSFTSSETDKMKNLAYTQAAKNAKQNADTIATALGVTVGAPHRISVNYSSPTPRAQPMLMAKMVADSSPETISLGQIIIKAAVAVDFEITK